MHKSTHHHTPNPNVFSSSFCDKFDVRLKLVVTHPLLWSLKVGVSSDSSCLRLDSATWCCTRPPLAPSYQFPIALICVLFFFLNLYARDCLTFLILLLEVFSSLSGSLRLPSSTIIRKKYHGCSKTAFACTPFSPQFL